jgi:hypothetical protein
MIETDLEVEMKAINYESSKESPKGSARLKLHAQNSALTTKNNQFVARNGSVRNQTCMSIQFNRGQANNFGLNKLTTVRASKSKQPFMSTS